MNIHNILIIDKIQKKLKFFFTFADKMNVYVEIFKGHDLRGKNNMTYRTHVTLLEQIKEFLALHGHKLSDIRWAGTKSRYVPRDEFLSTIENIVIENHDVEGVASNFVIVGDSWWVNRGIKGITNGSFWKGWVYHKTPKKPVNKLKVGCRKLIFHRDCEEYYERGRRCAL